MGRSDAVWLQGEVIKSSWVLPCEPNTLPGAVTHPVSTLMAPKPRCSEEARTPQHGGTAWLWGVGDFQAATSCSLLAQLQPSSDCKMHKRSQTIQTSPSFPVPQKLWDNKILAVLNTASDVLVDFFKDNSRLSRKKKIQICTYYLYGIDTPTMANLQLPLWWLSSWEEMHTAGSAKCMSWLQCIELYPGPKTDPLQSQMEPLNVL